MRSSIKSFSESATWPIDSIFGVLVDMLKKDDKIDYLICDDMGCEIADFIALSSEENRVIFIHCNIMIIM